MVNLERGGGETFDLEIARHLQSANCEVAFLSGLPLVGGPRIPSAFSKFKKPVRNFMLRSPYFGWFPWDKTRGGWRLRIMDFMMFEMRAARWVAAHQNDFDVIQVCELPFFVARAKAKGVRIPIVLRLTAPNFYDRWGGIRAADAVIASGETVARVRESLRSDCYDVPNAVDTEMFRPHPTPFRKNRGMGEDEFVILYVARFQDFKNHALLVDAYARFRPECPRSRLLLVGSGPLKPRIQRQVSERGLSAHVLFLGEQPFEQLPDIYAAADVMAISSDFESFCFAALEAMATGLPIVTTDCGWVPKLVNTEGGVVVPVRDSQALAEALLQMARDPAKRTAMGRRNREVALQRHAWSNSAGIIIQLYKRLTQA